SSDASHLTVHSSLHDALPIFRNIRVVHTVATDVFTFRPLFQLLDVFLQAIAKRFAFGIKQSCSLTIGIHLHLLLGQIEQSKFTVDRKSTRLNSSHVKSSYAVF